MNQDSRGVCLRLWPLGAIGCVLCAVVAAAITHIAHRSLLYGWMYGLDWSGVCFLWTEPLDCRACLVLSAMLRCCAECGVCDVWLDGVSSEMYGVSATGYAGDAVSARPLAVWTIVARTQCTL